MEGHASHKKGRRRKAVHGQISGDVGELGRPGGAAPTLTQMAGEVAFLPFSQSNSVALAVPLRCMFSTRSFCHPPLDLLASSTNGRVGTIKRKGRTAAVKDTKGAMKVQRKVGRGGEKIQSRRERRSRGGVWSWLGDLVTTSDEGRNEASVKVGAGAKRRRVQNKVESRTRTIEMEETAQRAREECGNGSRKRRTQRGRGGENVERTNERTEETKI